MSWKRRKPPSQGTAQLDASSLSLLPSRVSRLNQLCKGLSKGGGTSPSRLVWSYRSERGRPLVEAASNECEGLRVPLTATVHEPRHPPLFAFWARRWRVNNLQEPKETMVNWEGGKFHVFRFSHCHVCLNKGNTHSKGD
ncbi:hypothetical protein CLAIMM_12737 isoform 1 [Cladophialophora immunda]|nr:hypothetical protein CLAIMM_12737 isoform 1 [Cladophialophora immunda]